MTLAYDIERVSIACEQLLAAIDAADLAPFANVGVRASLHHPPASEA